MKKMFMTLGFFFLIALLPNSIPAQDKYEAPILYAGDTWRYRVGGKEWNRKVLRVEDDIYVIREKTYVGKQDLGYDKNTLNLDFPVNEDGTRTKFTGARRRVLDFPLFFGKEWSNMLKAAPHKGVSREKDFLEEYVVAAYEDVKVAAGTFKAFRIEYQNKETGRMVQTARATFWYSPEVKAIVKRTAEKGFAIPGMELISYKLKQ
jgi:hypothetical protein